MKDLLAPIESLAGGHKIAVTADDFAAHSLELVSQFSGADFIAGLDVSEAFTLIGQIDSHISSLMALRARAVVVAVGDKPERARTLSRGTDVALEDVRSSELGAYLRISPLAARNMAEVCRDLVRWLPTTIRHLEVGNIDYGKARIVAEGAHQLYTNLCLIEEDALELDDPKVFEYMERFEQIVCMLIYRRTNSEVRVAVRRAIAQLTPLAEETRHEVGKRERGVEFVDHGDGMTLMQALMTNLDAAKVKNVLEFCAKNDESLTGTHINRMSDALVGIVLGESEITAERRHSAAQVNVVVSLETLLGLSDAPADVIGADFALTANQVRELAGNSHLRRMVVDPSTGALLELGRRSYEPSRQMKDFVKLRDRKCRAPGCVRNAMRCDVDHIQAWDDGGETNVNNLASLCRRHHVLKTIGTWQYELKPNGDTVWTLPDGQVITDYANGWSPEPFADHTVDLSADLEPCPF